MADALCGQRAASNRKGTAHQHQCERAAGHDGQHTTFCQVCWTTRKWDTPAKAYDVSGNHKRRARTRPLPGPASTARHSVYARMYRYLTGETRTYARIPVTAVAELWRNGSPEVRRILIDTFGTDRVWCALEVAEHGYRQTNGSGIPITPPDADHDHNRLIDRFTDA